MLVLQDSKSTLSQDQVNANFLALNRQKNRPNSPHEINITSLAPTGFLERWAPERL